MEELLVKREMQNEIIDIQFLRSLAPFTNRDTAISKLQSLTWSVGKPAVATYKVGSETRGLLAIGIADGVGKCRILADDEDFQTLKVYTEALNKKVDDYIEVTDAWKEVVDAWRSVTDDRLVELEGKSHVQNTDTGTTSPTFQVDSTSNGPKLKGKGGDLELRNAGDTDYAGLTLGNITIKGNVTQEGDTFISQAETVEINDNLLLINKGEVGAGVTKGIAGIEIDRGTLPNYQIVFDESDKRFKAGEVGNIWPLALRDEEVNMVDGMFVTWDSATKRLKTTNIVPYNRPLSFKLDPEIADSTMKMRFGSGGLELSMDEADSILSAIPEVDRDGTKYSVITTNTNGIILGDYSGSNDEFIIDIKNSSFINSKLDKDVIIGGKNAYFMYYSHRMGSPNRIVASCDVKAPSFYRVSDSSEVLYHADIIDDLVTGGTSKVLSAEQGKLLSTKVNEIGDTYLPLSAGSGKHVTGDLYLDQKIYMKTLKPIYVQDSKGNYMQVLQGATLDGEEVIQLGASSKIRVESVTDFSKAVKFKDTVTLGTNSKLYYEVSSSSSRTILDPAGGNIVLGNVNVQDMKFSTAAGKDLYHLEGTTSYKIWTAHSFDPDSKANRVNPVVEQTLTLNTSTTGYKVKLGVDDTGYPGMFVSTQAGVSKSSLYYSPKSDALEVFTGTQSGVIATQNWVIDQVPTIFYARGFEVRKYNAAVNLDSDLLYGGAAVNYSDLTYWTNAPEGFSYGTVYQLGLQDYTNLNAQLAFDIIHTSDTDQKTNHLWFRTSGKAGYGVAGWKRVVTADELEGYVPSGDLANYYTKTQSDARYWTKTELVDPATKSGNNTFTGTNSFTAGKFNVGPFEVTNIGGLLINMTNTGGWERRLMWSNNSAPASRVMFGSYGNAGVASYAWIGIGDVEYNNAQYIFAPTKMQVPLQWSLDDTNGNSLVWSQSGTLANFGRATGTTKIRSGAVDLIHTKGTTDYKILDESNWESIIPNARWTYGFVTTAPGETKVDFNTVFAGPDAPKILFNYNHPLKGDTNSPTDMNYGTILQIDGNYNSNYGNVVLRPQLAFDVNHNVAGGTRYMWFRTANNLGFGDSSNWKRVVTADEGVAVLVMDANTYPSIARIDGTTYNWLRTPSQGLLPNTQVTLASGGTSYLGTSDWGFKNAYISNIYANNHYFGTTGMHLEGNADEIGLLNEEVAKKLKVGSLLVSANYANTTLVPTNGIFSSGRIQSNDSMLVGYTRNTTGGQLGYGLYYAGASYVGLGSEYSSGALILYKSVNPNIGSPGYNVPVAGTTIPCYLKLIGGMLKLGVGANKAYTAGEAVTMTEYTLATLDAVNTKLGSYLPLTGGTVGQLVVSAVGSSPIIVNNSDIRGTDVIQTFRVKGANKFLFGWSESGGGAFIQRSDNNRCMVLMSDGLYTGSSLGNVARVATMTDLGSYATQSWVTSQGYLTSHQAIYALTFAAGAFAAKTFTPTSSAVTVNVPTKTSHLTNDSGFLTSVPSTYATQTWVTSQGYLTSITKSMVTTALGYTPPTTNTTYSQATSSTLGLVKIGATGLASKNYAVQLNSSGQMYVAVPWTDTNTTYSAATSSTYGLVKIGATGLASKNYAVQLNSSGQMYVAVPWTDTDTNTHYTTRLYAGASGTAANSATTSPYIKVTDDNTYRNQIRLLGRGATSVSSDASGNITITSTNTTYGLATASSNGLMSSSQYTKLSNCIETVSATNMVTSVQVVDTIPATSSQVTGRLYLKFA